jgi:hypothetical protein
MEQELQIDSCLFGGPPVRDDIIKLGESQIGFMNIFARPLFEAVTDILPAMQFAVDEILANKAVWEKKIDDERLRRQKNPKLTLGQLSPSFSADPAPSPFSGGPGKPTASTSAPPNVLDNHRAVLAENEPRRGSTGSVHPALDASQRSSLVGDKNSRRASAVGIVSQRNSAPRENHGSRRGSGDPSLTAIIVTQASSAPETASHESTSVPELATQAQHKDSFGQPASKKEKDSARPVTAPSHARRSPGKHHHALSPPSAPYQQESCID